jgi:hypothetical protein
MTDEKKIIITIGLDKLHFTVTETDGTTAEHEYAIDKKMSVAANLREVFRKQSYMNAAKKTPDGIPCISATLMVSTPVVLVPAEEDFEPNSSYDIAITGYKHDEKYVTDIPLLDAVAIYPVNSDMKLVIEDNCSDVEVGNIIIPVWQTLYKKYYSGTQERKLFVYFFDGRMNICYFEHHRFRYANSFEMTTVEDMMYYILYVWKQLGMNATADILSLCGNIPARLEDKLKIYVEKITKCEL